MSQLLGRPSSKTPRPPKVRRLREQEDDTDSMVKGMILAAIIWPTFILILWLATRHLGADSNASFSKPARKAAFNIELSPDSFIMPSKPVPPPQKFVEVNPDAPENIPDKTNNFGAQNQQVAQEKPTPDGKSDRPATTGKKDFESNQIVSGQLTPPQPAPTPEPPPTPEIEQVLQQAAARRAQTPLPGFEKREGTNPDGFGMNVNPPADNATAVPEKLDGQKDAPSLVGNPMPTQFQIDPQKPQERHRLPAQRVRPAILADNQFGTQNIGLAAFDSRWSNYGAYLQRLIDSVQIQWERLIVQSNVYPPTGTVVTVKFRIEASEGNVTEIIDAQSTGGQQAAVICKSAITSRAPYGKWTDDMVAVLGESQEMTFSFHYGM